MSNPLKRRMAQAALLLAAGAAPAVGVGAGSAAALPVPSDLGTLDVLDSDGVNTAVKDATETAGEVAEELGSEALRRAWPILEPMLQQAAAETTQATGSLISGTTRTLAENGDAIPSVNQRLNGLMI